MRIPGRKMEARWTEECSRAEEDSGELGDIEKSRS